MTTETGNFKIQVGTRKVFLCHPAGQVEIGKKPIYQHFTRRTFKND